MPPPLRKLFVFFLHLQLWKHIRSNACKHTASYFWEKEEGIIALVKKKKRRNIGSGSLQPSWCEKKACKTTLLIVFDKYWGLGHYRGWPLKGQKVKGQSLKWYLEHNEVDIISFKISKKLSNLKFKCTWRDISKRLWYPLKSYL